MRQRIRFHFAALRSSVGETTAPASGAQEYSSSTMSDAPAPDGRRRSDRPQGPAQGSGRAPDELFAALDLGTNNCRLLVAARTRNGFRVVDAYSRIVRLGEGLTQTGRLQPAAMERALEALKVCADRLRRRGSPRIRAIATQACRSAENGVEFLARVAEETGLRLEIIPPREEARLSVAGCLNLLDLDMDAALVLDVGGGSTELSWVDLSGMAPARPPARRRCRRSAPGSPFPIGVVSLAENFPEARPGQRSLVQRDGRGGEGAHRRLPPRRSAAGRVRGGARPSDRHLRRDHQPGGAAPGAARAMTAPGGRPVADPERLRGHRRQAAGAHIPRSAPRSRASAPTAPTWCWRARRSCRRCRRPGPASGCGSPIAVCAKACCCR